MRSQLSVMLRGVLPVPREKSSACWVRGRTGSPVLAKAASQRCPPSGKYRGARISQLWRLVSLGVYGFQCWVGREGETGERKLRNLKAFDCLLC